jgi:hypothetical protein
VSNRNNAGPYSITSSARASTVVGMSMPSEGEAGLAARGSLHWPSQMFLTLASSAAPKFQSQETSREQSGDTRQPLRHPGDLRGSRICRRGRIDELRMYIVKSACIPAEY